MTPNMRVSFPIRRPVNLLAQIEIMINLERHGTLENVHTANSVHNQSVGAVEMHSCSFLLQTSQTGRQFLVIHSMTMWPQFSTICLMFWSRLEWQDKQIEMCIHRFAFIFPTLSNKVVRAVFVVIFLYVTRPCTYSKRNHIVSFDLLLKDSGRHGRSWKAYCDIEKMKSALVPDNIELIVNEHI